MGIQQWPLWLTSTPLLHEDQSILLLKAHGLPDHVHLWNIFSFSRNLLPNLVAIFIFPESQCLSEDVGEVAIVNCEYQIALRFYGEVTESYFC